MHLEKLSVTHVLPTLDKKFGGPVSVATDMVQELTRQGIKASLFPFPDTHSGKWNVWKIRRLVESSDIVHIHCLWNLNATIAAYWARCLGKPYIITPHGMLGKWALEQKPLRKTLYANLLENKNLRGAAKVQFLNVGERREAQYFDTNLEGFILPNGINFKQYEVPPDPKYFAAKFPQFEGKIIALFLGRVHPKKGFDVLLPSFAQALKSLPNLHLIIAGPSQGRFKDSLIANLKALSILNNVTFFDFVQGLEKLRLLKRADLFVLPSYQEGDPVAVKEAMFCKVPVLVTPECNLPEVHSHGAGVVAPPRIADWTDAILTVSDPASERKVMGENGHNLILENYSWEKIASHLIDVYRNLPTDQRSPDA